VLSSLLFGIGSHDPVTFALVTLLLIVVALLATLVPARRAASVNPMEALRAE
jgi:ABC-type lipoprotein release transport system permease subunit